MPDGIRTVEELAGERRPDRVADLRELFPEAFADGVVDLARLRVLLGDAVPTLGADEPQERYGLSWPGKREAIRLAQRPSTGTLDPLHHESVGWAGTRNAVVEGENLEVLKLLQKPYYGSVKLIYLDPPYNTGHDFIYEDDFAEPTAAYLRRSGQVDGQGFRTSANRETSGRFHSDWLSMMYPRLVLARSLLAEDGALIVSIDDGELASLRHLVDEIFGSENFVATLIHQRAKGGGNARHVVRGHDYALVVAKSLRSLPPLRRDKVVQGRVEEIDGVRYLVDDDVIRKTFGKYEPGVERRCLYEELVEYKGEAKKREVDERIARGELFLLPWGDGKHAVAKRTPVREASSKLYSIVKVLSELGRKDLERLGLDGAFDYPKPVDFVQQLVRAATSPNGGDLVLDFFAGSGTTAEAVLRQNADDGGDRRFLLVQLPEESGQPGLPTLAAVTRERVRRAGRLLRSEAGAGLAEAEAVPGDTGFRAFRLSASHFREWSPEASTLLGEDLEVFVDNVEASATDEQIVHEILLKAGVRLDTSLEALPLAGETLVLAEGGAVAVSAARRITPEFIEALLDFDPAPRRIFLLDSAFGEDDSLKLNARLRLAARHGETDPDRDHALRTV
ncbi:adenine-specific DNA-methyltransferase [Arthrobacter woluwensis]|uniref:site-specific DNA-methyltransferase n=1 Tax=Arthrobacter woluwensis TaxID=156980 RepID=UPI0027823376|nr:site-specific DNA-methyltransferase [Arthrobacter woluwensis]MDQ0707608.1 adenine-specific DNA-methyltransferase [Arthrobacter woluwensis]